MKFPRFFIFRFAARLCSAAVDAHIRQTDAAVIGGPYSTGQVRAARVVGVWAMIDSNESDWKVLAVDLDNPLARTWNVIHTLVLELVVVWSCSRVVVWSCGRVVVVVLMRCVCVCVSVLMRRRATEPTRVQSSQTCSTSCSTTSQARSISLHSMARCSIRPSLRILSTVCAQTTKTLFDFQLC